MSLQSFEIIQIISIITRIANLIEEMKKMELQMWRCYVTLIDISSRCDDITILSKLMRDVNSVSGSAHIVKRQNNMLTSISNHHWKLSWR